MLAGQRTRLFPSSHNAHDVSPGVPGSQVWADYTPNLEASLRTKITPAPAGVSSSRRRITSDHDELLPRARISEKVIPGIIRRP